MQSNKELEEAIKKLKWYELYSGLGNGTCIVNIKDLEKILNYIENSIPKEKVEEKIKELAKIAKKKDVIPETIKEEKIYGSYVYSQRFNADGYIAEIIVNVLQKLLEGK